LRERLRAFGYATRNKRTSSVKFLATVPTGSWGLLDADGNLLGVYDGDMSDLEAGAGAAAASLMNNTIHTIGAAGPQPEASQIIYPGITAALDPGLALELSRVTVYTQVPDGAFCLYEFALQGGKQWIVWAQPGESVSLAAIGADNIVSSVYNRTAVTLELRANSDGTGVSQFFYPSAFADVATAGLTGQASLATVLNGAPAGYYCLYGGLAKTGKQWVFREVDSVSVNLTDPRVAAGDAVLSVENLTSGTLELFRNDNGTGASQLFYPGLAVDVTTAGLAGLARSVVAYSGPPANYYCLYANPDKTGNRWVFPGTAATVKLTAATIGGGNVASLVENNTVRTLALFKNDNGTGDSQFFYPGSTSAVTVSGLDKKSQSATVYEGAPNEHYCLYGGSPQRQWVFKAAPGTDNSLASSGAASTVTQVQNKTAYTIELFAETNGTGAYQLFYPQTNVSVRSDFQNRAKLARCYNGPPANYFCLYDGTNQSGSQWVFRDDPGKWWDATGSDQNWNDKISSVYNRTPHTIQLFEATGQGGRGELFYPGQNAKANVTAINNLASSVACYNGCPDGYYCLFEGADQSGNQYVLRPSIGNVNIDSIGANDKISSVRNLTNYTIRLWADPGPSGVWQLCYPSQNANVQSNLDNKTTIVTVYDGPPANFYCLYEHGPGSGRQWLFDEYSTEVNLTISGISAVGISNVRNNTMFTLELFAEANATGSRQMFYPGLTTAATSAFNDKAKYARLHRVSSGNRSSLRSGYFCLFEHENYLGIQWVFEIPTRSRLTDINAADKASSAANNSPTKVTLYWNDNWSGWDWKVPGNTWHATLRAGTENLNDHTRSIASA
jgi:peptidase inhibitor family I36